MTTPYPHLDEFFGTYFHQDWREDSPTAVGIVERYLAEWPTDEVREAAKELGQLLAAAATEDELAGVLQRLGSFYNPRADGLSYGEWLNQVYRLLASLGDD